MGGDAPPDWLVTPPEGWTAKDLHRLPDEAPRCEVLDGALIVRASQTVFHSRVTWRLADALEDAAPPDADVLARMHIRLDRINQVEPDVIMAAPGVPKERELTWYWPGEIVLVAEVVSEDTWYRDRIVKPAKYAAVGIPYFWRVEQDEAAPIVHVFELQNGSYVETAIERKQPRASGRPTTLMHLEMSVRIDRENRLVPDVLVATSAAGIVPQREWFWPIEVALAVEIVSPDTQHQDRVVKHDRYARAGIPHYWRIEDHGGVPTVYVYEIRDGGYVETAVEREEVSLERPFPMKIRVDQLYRGVT